MGHAVLLSITGQAIGAVWVAGRKNCAIYEHCSQRQAMGDSTTTTARKDFYQFKDHSEAIRQ
jgi:hypothetical protein